MGVRIESVAKDFGAVRVIEDISMDIPTGSFAVFVGPSGCGKSTLLRMIAGLEDTSDGKILIDDRDVTSVEPSDRGVAMVFQSYALYPHLTVFENMAFSLRLAKTKKAEVTEMVTKAARILQLEEHLAKKPSALSGGQRQRVAIGRAIVRQPKVFLFDEPLSNLDAELRVAMRLELTRLHRKIGATMIYVTHDQVEAMTLADKIFVLKDGIVQQAGAPLDLYDDPDNRFVAGFIGSPAMTFIPAEVLRKDGDDLVLRTSGTEAQEFRAAVGTAPEAGTQVEIGVRPEHWQITDGGMPVRVEVSEELGDLSYLHTRLADETEIIVERKGVRERLDGRMIGISADPKKVLVFDKTGQRLR